VTATTGVSRLFLHFGLTEGETNDASPRCSCCRRRLPGFKKAGDLIKAIAGAVNKLTTPGAVAFKIASTMSTTASSV
jgi:hypothetical protein